MDTNPISHDELIKRINQHLGEIGFPNTVSNPDEIHSYIKQYTDPISPQDLRQLMSLVTARFAIENRTVTESPLKRGKIPLLMIVWALAFLKHDEYIDKLLSFYRQRSRSGLYWIIAKEQSMQRRFDEATRTIENIEYPELFARALVELVLQMQKNGDSRAKQYYRLAFDAINNVNYISTTPHSSPESDSYRELVEILVKAREFDFALEVARTNRRLSDRAKSLCLIAKELIPGNIDFALQVLEEAKQLLYHQRSWYENLHNWKVNVLCEVAVVMYEVDVVQADKLMMDAVKNTRHKRYDNWTIAIAYARAKKTHDAIRFVYSMDGTDQIHLLSEIATIIDSYNAPLAEKAFKAAIALVPEIPQVHIQRENLTGIATDLVKTNHIKPALRVIGLIKDKRRYPMEITSLLAKNGELVRAIQISLSKKTYWDGFISDAMEYREAFEAVEKGLCLTILHDILKILAWVEPIWDDVRSRIPPA